MRGFPKIGLVDMAARRQSLHEQTRAILTNIQNLLRAAGADPVLEEETVVGVLRAGGNHPPIVFLHHGGYPG